MLPAVVELITDIVLVFSAELGAPTIVGAFADWSGVILMAATVSKVVYVAACSTVGTMWRPGGVAPLLMCTAQS